jgi:hypothetical protein
MENNQGGAPASPSLFFPPDQQLTMNRPIGRSSDRRRMLMPAEQQAVAEEDRRATMFDEMEAEMEMNVAIGKSTKVPTKRAQVTSVACHHCQRQKSKVSWS